MGQGIVQNQNSGLQAQNGKETYDVMHSNAKGGKIPPGNSKTSEFIKVFNRREHRESVNLLMSKKLLRNSLLFEEPF